MDRMPRHWEALRAARASCRLESPGQLVITIIAAVSGIAVIWVGAGSNEAWGEILAKAGSTLAILLIFPAVYFSKLFDLGPRTQRKARVLQIIGLPALADYSRRHFIDAGFRRARIASEKR